MRRYTRALFRSRSILPRGDKSWGNLFDSDTTADDFAVRGRPDREQDAPAERRCKPDDDADGGVKTFLIVYVYGKCIEIEV